MIIADVWLKSRVQGVNYDRAIALLKLSHEIIVSIVLLKLCGGQLWCSWINLGKALELTSHTSVFVDHTR